MFDSPFLLFVVLWKPVFMIHPHSTFTYLDDGIAVVNLSCAAYGFPPPLIAWLQNNSTITNGTVIQNGSISSLSVALNKTTNLSLKYRCVAGNSLGKTFSEEATLTIAKRNRNLINFKKGRLTIQLGDQPITRMFQKDQTSAILVNEID